MLNFHSIFFIYLLIINLIGLLSMIVDKQKAIHHSWRIKERTLFLIAIIGGSLGSIIGMYLVRHKTKHRLFTMGMPIIFIIQCILLIIF